MNRPTVEIVVARADNDVIGAGWTPAVAAAQGPAPFQGGDSGAPMIMGRKTFESLPGLLPGRRHIVSPTTAAGGATAPSRPRWTRRSALAEGDGAR